MTAVAVTAGHIAKGEPRSPFGCPVAHALTDAFPGTVGSVGRNYLGVYPATGRASRRGSGPPILRIRLPDSVREFIDAFDNGDPVEPFTFDLDAAVTP